jgi:type IX secretion system PorP/SprF family membrane protein
MKVFKKIWFVAFIAIGVFNTNQLFAQSEPMFSQYTFNEIFINPAYAGSHEALSFSSVYRKQWVNIEGAPTTKTFTAHSHLFKSKVGLGITAYQDQIGVAAQTGFFANYAFRIRLNKGTLSLGMLGGYSGYQERLTEIKTTESGDARFSSNTPMVFAPNFGFGTYYYTKRFYFGVSVPRMITNKLIINQYSQVERVDGSLNTDALHYFVATGFIFDVNPLVKLRPSMMIKAVLNAPIEYDVNMSALLYTALWVGAGYRSGDSWNILTALQVNNQLRIGYSYDYTITKLKDFAGGSHEFSMNYVLKYNTKKITSPRYF